MSRQHREFECRIKSVQVKGETKVDKDGEVLAEPEIVLTLVMPLTNDNIRSLNFLEAAKISGAVGVSIETSQLTFDFGGVTTTA